MTDDEEGGVNWDWTGGWAIGYYIGAGVVVTVVALILAMTAVARRVAEKVEDVAQALRAAEGATNSLWSVRDTKDSAAHILDGARAARLALTAKQDQR